MEPRGMTVIMEDGFRMYFIKEDGQIKCFYLRCNTYHENNVSEESIHIVKGDPLSFLYYEGSKEETFKTEAPVKEFNYVY